MSKPTDFTCSQADLVRLMNVVTVVGGEAAVVAGDILECCAGEHAPHVLFSLVIDWGCGLGTAKEIRAAAKRVMESQRRGGV